MKFTDGMEINTDWNWYVASDAMDAVKKAYDAYLVEAKKL